jgi:hypothetical protein
MGRRSARLDQANDKGDIHVSLKTRLIGSAGALAIAGSFMVAAAPAAHADVVPAGSCQGATLLGTITPGLTDTTAHQTVALKALKETTGLKRTLGGTCDGTANDPLDPATATQGGQPPAQLTPKAVSSKLIGSASCSQTATGPGTDPGDPAAAAAYPLNGKVSYTMSQTNALAKPWAIQAYIALTGITGDVVGVQGIVIKGADVGAAVGGSLWQNPAVKLGKTDPAQPGYNATGYSVDPNAITSLIGCADGVPGTVAGPGVQLVLAGGGTGSNGMDSSTSPLLGSSADGLTFHFGA